MKRVVYLVASFPYTPALLGRGCRVARWHHRIHLIPGSLFELICRWAALS